jgi:hypothetical protein
MGAKVNKCRAKHGIKELAKASEAEAVSHRAACLTLQDSL